MSLFALSSRLTQPLLYHAQSRYQFHLQLTLPCTSELLTTFPLQYHTLTLQVHACPFPVTMTNLSDCIILV